MKTIFKFYPFLLIPTLLISGCDIISPSGTDGNLIYSNGFNTEKAVAELGEMASFSKEAPSGGGSGSAFISGGCVVPHATQTIVITESGALKLSAWGKEVRLNGGIELKNLRTDKTIRVIISGHEWKEVGSSELLSVIKGDKLELSLSSGGFVPGGMLVTQINVSMIN